VCAPSTGPKNRANRGDLGRLTVLLQQKKWMPIICFSFSRRECEQNALNLSNTSLNDEKEQELVVDVCAE
jgi:ATP-dependent RNA helicase DOB1